MKVKRLKAVSGELRRLQAAMHNKLEPSAIADLDKAIDELERLVDSREESEQELTRLALVLLGDALKAIPVIAALIEILRQ